MTTSATEGFARAAAQGGEAMARSHSPQAKIARTNAEMRQRTGQRQLDQIEHENKTGSVQAQIDATTAQNESLSKQLAKRDTFDSFRLYEADGNPKHLIRAIRENPTLSEVYKDTLSYEKLDLENDKALIANAGLDPSQADPAAFSKRYLKSMNADGEMRIVDMFKVYKGTGFTKYMNDEELERLLKQATIAKKLMPPGSGGAGGAGADRTTAMQRNATAVAEAQDRIDEARANGEQPTTKDMETVAFGDQKKAGVTPGKFEIARETTTAMLEHFGGTDKFFDTDFSKRSEYLQAIPYIREIEQLEGIELTAAQKGQLTDIRGLIAVGNDAGEITDQETGLLDNMLFNFKKYMFDDVGGIEASSAYAAFRNATRHALYGSALTDAEIKSFNEAFGTLGQKTGPVLQQFKTAISQVKANLDSIAKMTNPYSAQVRLGSDMDAIDDMIYQLDNRIRYLSGEGTTDTGMKTTLDSIFKGPAK